jgi:hypothetical protein
MPASADQSLETYIRSVEVEAKAEVCIRHVAGYASEFERRYQAWRKVNAAALAEGAMLATARGMTNASGPNVQGFARMNAEVLEALPEDDRQRHCNELLAFFTEGPAK